MKSERKFHCTGQVPGGSGVEVGVVTKPARHLFEVDLKVNSIISLSMY
jgi:hypothetical protein